MTDLGSLSAHLSPYAQLAALRRVAGLGVYTPPAPGGGVGAGASPSAAFPTLTFEDTFDTDLSQWNVLNNLQLPYDVATTRSANVFLRSGELVIAAKRENYNGRAWTSGYLTTNSNHGPHVFEQQYGYFEADIKINTTAGNSLGLWPAWWLRPANTAYTGELDIMEAWGEGAGAPRTDYPAGAAFCSLLADTNHHDNRKKTIKWPAPSGGRLSDGYHKYALEWTSAGFTCYLDGVVPSGGHVTNAGLGFPASNYASPFHLRLQMQIGQAYWGFPNSGTIGYSEMLVRSVRVWGP